MAAEGAESPTSSLFMPEEFDRNGFYLCQRQQFSEWENLLKTVSKQFSR